MDIGAREVTYLARLARIRLESGEVASFAQELGTLLTYFAKLQAVPTDKVEPTYHALPLMNVFREDSVRSSLPVGEVLSGAPHRQGAFFAVPRVIENP